MSKILLEKCEVGMTGILRKSLPNWATLFNNEDELLEFLEKHKGNLTGCGFMITIREVKEYKKVEEEELEEVLKEIMEDDSCYWKNI